MVKRCEGHEGSQSSGPLDANVALMCRFSVAIMMDTEGSEVHTSELEQPMKAEVWPILKLDGSELQVPCMH